MTFLFPAAPFAPKAAGSDQPSDPAALRYVWPSPFSSISELLQMLEYPVSATRIPSCGKARVISSHKRSGQIGADTLASPGAHSRRQPVITPAAQSPNAESRGCLPRASRSFAKVALGSPIRPSVLGYE